MSSNTTSPSTNPSPNPPHTPPQPDTIPSPETQSQSSSQSSETSETSETSDTSPNRPLLRSATSQPYSASKRGPSALRLFYAHRPSRSRSVRASIQRQGIFRELFDHTEDPIWPPAPSEPAREGITGSVVEGGVASRELVGDKTRKRDKLRALSSRVVEKIRKLGSGKRSGQSGRDSGVVDAEGSNEQDGGSGGQE